MAIRKIVQEGDPCLEKECRLITEFTPRIHQLMDDLRDTLAQAQGAGLAAPQVGVLRQACIVLLEDESILELLNPEIIEEGGEIDDFEGCLSIPGMRGVVVRPQKVKVRAQDRFGKPFEYEAEGFTARAICHEVDHLHGILFTNLTDELYDIEDLLSEGEE